MFTEGLCRRPGGQGRDRLVDRLLQRPAPSSGARQPGSHGGLARRRHRLARGECCGYDAALGRRSCVAHSSTAAGAPADLVRGVIRKAEPTSPIRKRPPLVPAQASISLLHFLLLTLETSVAPMNYRCL